MSSPLSLVWWRRGGCYHRPAPPLPPQSRIFLPALSFPGARSQASGAGVVGWRDSNMTKPSDVLKRSGETKLTAREVEAAKLLLLKKFGK